MIYNFNLGIGWASSGVEYAQLYRARAFREAKMPAKFIFTDMFPRDNIQAMTENIGFFDDEIIWLYLYFTDQRIAPCSYSLERLKQFVTTEDYKYSRNGNIGVLEFGNSADFYRVYFTNDESDIVGRVEMVKNGKLIRKDFYTYCRSFSEYYAPLDGSAHLYQRRFFNEDGSVAYDEIIDGDVVTYRMKDTILCSKEELVGYMVKSLKLTSDDIIIIDRTTGIGQAILENAAPAKLATVLHADHYSAGNTDDTYILWNNYYEYDFAQSEIYDLFISSTEAQRQTLLDQFKKYYPNKPLPNVVTIPVGALDELKQPAPDKPRKKHSLITASRLANEKHIDQIIKAVNIAKNDVPDLTLDIYGKGGEEDRLKSLIKVLGLSDRVKMMGQQNLTDVYMGYEAYISASGSEGFGLTLLEAVGSGLPIIGFDVPYGNPTFIRNNENGVLIPVKERMTEGEKSKALAAAIVTLFKEADMEKCHEVSYEVAKPFLKKEVVKLWERSLMNLTK